MSNQTFEIHISDVLSFKSCRRKWDWSSLLRRNLTPITPYAPFFTGRIIHAALDAYYRFGLHPVNEVDLLVKLETRALREAYPTIYAANEPSINEQAEFCKAVLAHYVEWAASYNNPFNDRELDFVNVEQSFNVPMRTNRGFLARRLRLAGRFDGVVRNKRDDKLYLWEIKTCKSIDQRLKQLDLEEQADAYALAAQELLGEPIAGIVYTLIRKTLPATPRALKSGMLSQDKSIDTTFEHYLAAIRAHHGHIATRDFINEQYGPFLQHLLDNGNPFFARVMIKRSPEQLRTARDELYATALEMTNPAVAIYKSAGIPCNWCIFREACIAKQQGEIAYSEELLANNYMPNTYHLRGEEDV